uniref:DASH complex subunit SPC19 n=1 Tax=Bionectria ochroleuca TaxID=29856 RepID=A0A0B7JV53_BIOOC
MATSSNITTYADCVCSLRSSLKFLESSVETLDSGVSDFPRLVSVLKTVRIERQERRIETLKARSELQHGRLAADTDGKGKGAAKSPKPKGRKLTGEDKLRARAVKQRKEALRYGVERLELEVLQKERELRKQLEG